MKDDRSDREGNDEAGPHTKKELPLAKAWRLENMTTQIHYKHEVSKIQHDILLMKRTLVWEPYSSSTAYKMCSGTPETLKMEQISALIIITKSCEDKNDVSMQNVKIWRTQI